MNKLLLRYLSPEKLRWLGFWLIIIGLIGEAAVIIFVTFGKWEKVLTSIFTVMIAIGVWLEKVGADESTEPRHLASEQQQRIASKMAAFKGLRAVLGAVPPSAKNTNLLDQIFCALKISDVDAFINLSGVEASVSPTGKSNIGIMLTKGFPDGVTMHYVTGNERGEAFAKALARALNDENIIAAAVGDRDESRMNWRLSQGAENGLTRNDKQFEPVIVVVGDKP
jgi:uncharacterized membrane protein